MRTIARPASKVGMALHVLVSLSMTLEQILSLIFFPLHVMLDVDGASKQRAPALRTQQQQ